MIEIQPQTKTIICIGTGGVGKTTFAATLAFGKASEGLKVLVLTIDPSMRLAQALNFKADGKIYDITSEEVSKKSKNRGKVAACVLQHEQIFQEFLFKAVQKNAQDKLSRQDIVRLTQNKLYKQLSTKLSGSQEFTSLYKLNSFVASGEYDLVILDTPPAQHTWHFLLAPQKLAQLFNEGIASWFRSSTEKQSLFKKALNTGTTQVLKALELLTGAEFIKELGLFFQAIQTWQVPLEKQVMDCHRLLNSGQTEFFLITNLDASRIEEARRLSREISVEGYNLTTLIINRAPQWINVEDSDLSQNLKNYKQYFKSIEAKLHETSSVQSSAWTKSNLKLYKSSELSQNELNASGLVQIYNHIEKI